MAWDRRKYCRQISVWKDLEMYSTGLNHYYYRLDLVLPHSLGSPAGAAILKGLWELWDMDLEFDSV